MKKFLITSAIALAMVGAGTSAFAAWGQGEGQGRPDFDSTQFQEMRAEMEARHAEMSAAIQSGFQAWSDLVSEMHPDTPMLETITPDNFSQFQEMHSLMEQGRELQKQAMTIHEELGLESQTVFKHRMGGKHMGQEFGQGKGMGRHMIFDQES